MKTKEYENYRSVLKAEYISRSSRNSKYSLNAFSRDLGISPSRISEIFSGKQGLSPKRARLIGERLGYKLEKLDWFCDLVSKEHARNQIQKQIAEEKLSHYRNGVKTSKLPKSLPFSLKWHHFAIRRMTLLKDFESDPRWIAQRLDISEQEAAEAINEMLKVGLLVLSEDGHLHLGSNYESPHKDSHKKEKANIFRHISEKALLKYGSSDEKKQKHGLHFLTISKDQYEEVKRLITDLEDKIDNLTHQAKEHQDLCVLMVNFFPLSSQNLTE